MFRSMSKDEQNKRTDLGFLGAGDGDDVVALREEPREGDLAGGRAVFGADSFQPGSEREDVGEVGGAVSVVWRVSVRNTMRGIGCQLWAAYRAIVRRKSSGSKSSGDFYMNAMNAAK